AREYLDGCHSATPPAYQLVFTSLSIVQVVGFTQGQSVTLLDGQDLAQLGLQFGPVLRQIAQCVLPFLRGVIRGSGFLDQLGKGQIWDQSALSYQQNNVFRLSQ
ncbi:hypothetical protein, partial [Deinococcus sp. GbtcB9]|uniref:hypothetical protein n=1 Tax=Deinococcus sp. GbtcB9 TaxID=2824754 RepID=UPI001C30BE00